MNDLQLYLAVGVPTIAVLASMTLSLVQISAIREDIREVRADMREIRADMRDVRADMQEIRTEMQDIRSDIKLIVGKLVDLDNRVTRIEERFGH